MSWKRAAPLTRHRLRRVLHRERRRQQRAEEHRHRCGLGGRVRDPRQAGGHLATGVLLVLAAISLMSFLTHLWTRIADARAPEAVSPLPIVAAGVVGGVHRGRRRPDGGASRGVRCSTRQPLPGADVLRLGNDSLGFAIVGVAGMLAAALSIAGVSLQARSAGVFGARLTRFSLVVAAVLLGGCRVRPDPGTPGLAGRHHRRR